MRNAVRIGVALAVCLALVGGCSSSHPPAPAPSRPVVPIVQHSLPATVANQPAVRSRVQVTGCMPITNGWRASGTATNPGTGTARYQITVYFTTTSASVLDYDIVKVSAGPGKTVTWTAAKTFLAQPKTLCALVGVAVV